MKKTQVILREGTALSALALIGAGMLFAAPAIAQDTATVPGSTGQDACIEKGADNCPPGSADQAAQNTQGDIVVTGSRIRAPNAESIIPVTSIGGDTFFEQGRNSIGDTLNDLPQLSSTFAQQNPGLGVGIAGLNLLDLRGLGTARTLVLVNGRRHVPSDILNNAVSVDVNTIPNNLIDRVDIVTGGNSAVYGSDAIAGVVNFILKRNYDGIELRANAGITAEGFGANQLLSGLVGKNFAGGKGNITFSAEYAHQERVFASDIPWYASADGFGVVDVDPAGLTNGSDGYPDRVFLRDIRSSTISRYGLIPISQRPSQAGCGTGIGSTNGAPSTVGGVPYSCTYLFTADGRLTPQTGTRYGSGPNSGVIGGNGQTGREDNLLSVYPYSERYNFNLLSHYEFSPAFDAFIEAKWVRVKALGNNAGPSFTQGTRSQFDSREQIRLDNPFLNPTDRAALTSLILASNCNPSFTVNCPNQTNIGTTANPVFINGNLTDAQRAAIADGSYRFVIGKQFADSGIRDELFRRTTWRVVGGFRGDLGSGFNYEVAANYGKFTQSTTTFGYLDKQRFLLSLDAGRNPVTGQIQCRAQFDPTAAISYPNTADGRARLAADVAACVPYNPFGAADNSAASKYFVYNAVDHAKIEQFDATAYISGSTESFFNLPGGPVRFALGGEYRSEKAAYIQDPYSGDEAGYTTSLTQLSFAPPAFKVKEAYGELQVPLLKDIPFIHELTLSGAARVSDYRGSTGTVWAYNYGGEWSPISDIRFRGNFGRSVRAPNVTETAGALVPNFAPGFQDPCRAANIGSGTQYRADNCASDLGALLDTADFANQATYSLAVLSGSNPNLQAEKSDSWTFGTVIQPRWIRNFTLSVDYYNIKVDGVITAVSAQQIANSCYDLPTLDNPFCSLFTRYRGPGLGANGEVPGQILANSLIQAPLNYAKRIRKGIDTQVNYRVDLGSNVSLSTNLVYTHAIKSSNYINPQDPDFEDRLLSELGSPKDEFQFDTDLTIGDLTLGYRLHYISAMYLDGAAYENFNALQGRPAQNADYAEIWKYPAVAYHAIRFQYDLKNEGGFGKAFQFYAGIDNLFDKHPPLGSTGTGTGSAIYDIRGRNLYAGIRASF